jgi:DNA mismatch endonuclease (patch repair protein)
MRANKRMGTKPETVLSKILRKVLVKSELPGSPDIVYSRERVVIFVNGCFWHRCPKCNLLIPKTNTEFWKRKFERNVERDQLNRRELARAGWEVIEVWEHEIRNNPRIPASRVKAAVRQRRRAAIGESSQ